MRFGSVLLQEFNHVYCALKNGNSSNGRLARRARRYFIAGASRDRNSVSMARRKNPQMFLLPSFISDAVTKSDSVPVSGTAALHPR